MENKKNDSILIVDDERANIMALNEILSLDYTIYIAKSAMAALKIIEDNPPDLILLDVLMPDMTGFEMLSRLKETDADIPVIFITGLDDPKNEEKGFELGAVDYIRKPFVSSIVKARVNTQFKIIRQMRINEQLSMTDHLTNLANRRKFGESADREWKMAIRNHQPISFLMMDLDRFKEYNDRYGHPQADELLKETAKIFTAAARRANDLAVRMGGEEFGLLLPGASAENALAIATRLRTEIENLRVPTDEGDLTNITISIGVHSAYPQVGDDLDEFIAKADENCYQAKNNGRNQVFGP